MSGVSVIICAAGRGERAGFSQNKILVPHLGITPLERCLAAFCLPEIKEILVAINEIDKPAVEEITRKYAHARVIIGGATRTQTVYNALLATGEEIVLVHDAARPFITGEMIKNCIQSVQTYGSGIAAIPAVDTLVTADENGKTDGYPNRDKTYYIQTPQGFLTGELKAAYQTAFAAGDTLFTDDSSLYSKYVRPAQLCQGSPENKKLTFPSDFYAPARVGFGVDTHAFGKEQDFILLGGVKIPSKSGLKAHSDGDVLVHALMDALLSAAGLLDIGHYFPDTDPAYAGANSMELLKKVVELVASQGFKAQNASVAVQAETPRLAPYIDEIRHSLSAALGLPPSAVGVTAGTNEKLGYVGEGKGVTVYASVLLANK